MIENNPSTYFAAANTPSGFQSYFQEIFSPDNFDSIYILKGGPGTGKSSFMRIISKLAQDAGFVVEEFLCSSDPKSLDGLLIPDKKLAILDGTYPHVSDPTYPGVVENIINTGAFWDREKLFKQKNKIITLIKEKKQHFKRGYQFLKACGEIETELQKLAREALMEEKLSESTLRLAKRHFKSKGNAYESVRITTAINGSGYQKLDTFIKRSNTVYIIEDLLFSGYFYLSKLHEEAKMTRQEMTISLSCQFPNQIDGIYFPKQSLAFVMGNRDYQKEVEGKQYHYINMGRFLDNEKLKEHKQKIKFGKRCCDMLRCGAIEAFSDAQAKHLDLESIYTSAMDFTQFDQCVKKISDEVINL